MSMALALAPSSKFSQGVTIIMNEAKQIKNCPNIIKFVKYLKKVWTPKAKIVSTFGLMVRTNNLTESFHRHIKEKLGGVHPSIWDFLSMFSYYSISNSKCSLKVEKLISISVGRLIE